MVSVSLVVPVYSGEAHRRRLVEAAEDLQQRWAVEAAPVSIAELILVDDGAIDGSPALLDILAKEKPWVIVLHLGRNFGQHPATVAGVLHTSGAATRNRFPLNEADGKRTYRVTPKVVATRAIRGRVGRHTNG